MSSSVMKKIHYFIIIYLLIGIVFYVIGYVPAPTLWESVFTFLYVVLLWPIVVGLHEFFN